MSRAAECGGASRHGSNFMPEHEIWSGIKKRCLSANHKQRGRYGGRGITICDRWRHDFNAFLSDMGPRPSPKHSVDRIDNDKGYEPSNCRWATMAEQQQNRSSTKLDANDVRLIRYWIRIGYSQTRVAYAFGVTQATIWRTLHGKCWANV